MSDPTAALRQRILAEVRQRPAPTRRRLRRSDWLTATVVAIVVVTIFVGFGGIRDSGAPRPVSLTAGTVLGSLAVVVAVAGFAVRRGSSMLGLPRSRLLYAVAMAPIALFAWKVFYSSLFAGGIDPWPTRIGHKCLGLSLLIGVLPLLAVVRARHGFALQHPRAAGAALGVLCGSIAAVFVDLWCPVGYPAHVAYGHVLPMVMLALLGAALGGASARR